eukprot:5331082-Prymnesium_polylepis.1
MACATLTSTAAETLDSFLPPHVSAKNRVGCMKLPGKRWGAPKKKRSGASLPPTRTKAAKTNRNRAEAADARRRERLLCLSE